MFEYENISGRNVERVEALSDGIFAVAMTILVLELKIPEHLSSEHLLVGTLIDSLPKIITWVLSMITLGVFWIAQQTQLDHTESIDKSLTWLHFLFLTSITLIPFSSGVFSNYPEFRTSLIVYWVNILFSGICLLFTWAYTSKRGLVKSDSPENIVRIIFTRELISQSFYVGGVIIGIFNISLGMGFIIFVQLNCAVLPPKKEK